jgi:hypothetical protein
MIERLSLSRSLESSLVLERETSSTITSSGTLESELDLRAIAWGLSRESSVSCRTWRRTVEAAYSVEHIVHVAVLALPR